MQFAASFQIELFRLPLAKTFEVVTFQWQSYFYQVGSLIAKHETVSKQYIVQPLVP